MRKNKFTVLQLRMVTFCHQHPKDRRSSIQIVVWNQCSLCFCSLSNASTTRGLQHHSYMYSKLPCLFNISPHSFEGKERLLVVKKLTFIYFLISKNKIQITSGHLAGTTFSTQCHIPKSSGLGENHISNIISIYRIESTVAQKWFN